jgi:hypothetical protein
MRAARSHRCRRLHTPLTHHPDARPRSKSDSASATRGWAIKYYKGLGTSTAAEAKAYFGDLATHQIDFALDDPAVTGYNARASTPWLGEGVGVGGGGAHPVVTPTCASSVATAACTVGAAHVWRAITTPARRRMGGGGGGV